MTRSVHGRFLKDENDAISDHLRNHVHLTNCIHLKNHMHRNSPILAERSLMKDLIALQRSRSLRDPSASPPSWHSPSIVDSLSKKLERHTPVHEGRRSVGLERRREGRRLSGSSPPVVAVATSKISAEEASRGDYEGVHSNSGIGRPRDSGGTKEDSSRRNHRSTGVEEFFQDSQKLGLANGLNHGKGEARNKRLPRKGKQSQNAHLKTLAEQLNDFPMDSDVQSSHMRHHGRCIKEDNTNEEPEASIHNYCNEVNKAKRRRSRAARRARASMASRDFGVRNEFTVASNSLAQGSAQHKYYMEGGEEHSVGLDVSGDYKNGCGIPWNWSRIHHRGKTFLDLAGRSLSCGLSESRLRKPHGQDELDMPVASESSRSSVKYDAEAAPLLVEPSGSQGSTDNAAWVHDYSGELGIFGNHSLKNDADSELASEVESEDQLRLRGDRHCRHQNMTQKYMPRNFRDLVGQHLVSQALSNAVLKRKVGLLYVFHGPHGTGKTSCARIFARALNCQAAEHPKPCGICTSCIAHDLGKKRNVKEVGPSGNVDYEGIMDLLDGMVVSPMQSQYKIFIFDDCDTLPPDSWSAISKVIDRAPRGVVFILISRNLDHLPHIIISRCQKFFFPKLKDADIIYTLQWIATKEGLRIDKDALKLIASRSDGSLRDAQMTLEQLSLLGQRISVPLVQELVGLISDEKLVDLLDLALSADTVNTVKNLRDIMEARVEPMALMSQLATIITDILAGSYIFTKERLRRKFFRRLTLSKEDMEKLRRALKTLSEAEKQLRTSNDKLTWLTAALLQLAPDRLYMLPSSSADTSFNHSPLVQKTTNRREGTGKGIAEHSQMCNNNRVLSADFSKENLQAGTAADVPYDNGKAHRTVLTGRKHADLSPQRKSDVTKETSGNISVKDSKAIEEIWVAVLEMIENDTLKQFMRQEGNLVSVCFGAAPTVQLTFSSQMTKSKADMFREDILQAFESVLGSPVTIEIRCESRRDARGGSQVPLLLPASGECSSRAAKYQHSHANNLLPKAGNEKELKGPSQDRIFKRSGSKHVNFLPSGSREIANSEIVELAASPRDREGTEQKNNIKQITGKGRETTQKDELHSSRQQPTVTPVLEGKRFGEHPQSQSLVKSRVSLAHVIQQAEGHTQRNGWSRHKAISIAEKLEQENLRLEPRSRSLLCWKASKTPRGKLSRLRIRSRRPRSLLKLVSCGRCLSAKSPR